MQDRFVLVGLLQISLGAPCFTSSHGGHMGIVLNYCQYGVLYVGSYYNTGPYINFPHFGNSNLGKLPYVLHTACAAQSQNRQAETRSLSYWNYFLILCVWAKTVNTSPYDGMLAHVHLELNLSMVPVSYPFEAFLWPHHLEGHPRNLQSQEHKAAFQDTLNYF